MGKKFLTFIVTLCMCFSLTSCAGLFAPAEPGVESSKTESSVETSSEVESSEESSKEESSEEVSSKEESSEEESSEESSSEESSSEEESSEESSSDVESSEESSSDEESSEEESSEEVKVYVTITFKQAGQEDIVKTIEQGMDLSDIPTPVAKTGYVIVWDTTDFDDIAENMTVTAVETAKTYTIVFDTKNASISQDSITVTYGQAYELPSLTDDDNTFKGWYYNGTKIANSGVWEMDVEGDITLVASWQSNWTGNY